MINLLPENIRANNKYAYKNVLLLRYAAISAFTMVAIGLVTLLGTASMQKTQQDLQKQIDEQNTHISTYKPLEAQGQQLATQLTTINTLLNRQVAFSTLLPDLAKTLPPGAILKQMDFTTSDLLPTPKPKAVPGATTAPTTSAANTKKPFVILASVTNRDVAATLLENIKANKDLFTDADLVDVTQIATGNSSSTSLVTRYPYNVTINAYLKKLDTAQSGGTKP